MTQSFREDMSYSAVERPTPSFFSTTQTSKSGAPDLRMDVDFGGIGFNVQQGIFVPDDSDQLPFEDPMQ